MRTTRLRSITVTSSARCDQCADLGLIGPLKWRLSAMPSCRSLRRGHYELVVAARPTLRVAAAFTKRDSLRSGRRVCLVAGAPGMPRQAGAETGRETTGHIADELAAADERATYWSRRAGDEPECSG
jgi:hypothetical protein